MKRLLTIGLVIFASTQIALAQTDAQKFNSANRLYLEHEYEKAIDLYSSIDISNPDLEYNLASAYFKAGKIGKAIVHLSRSLKLRPGDEDALANLRYIRSVKHDRENKTEQSHVINAVVAVANALPINNMIAITLFAYLLAAACALALILWNGVMGAKLSRWLIFFVAITIVCAGLTGYRIAWFERTDRAIAIENSIDAYSGPSDITDHLFTFHEGTEVTIGRKDGVYVFVTLSSGLSGWARLESLEKI
ncbi:hypothetical protein MNBD_NITROSPINAE02-111 [hydrothermal vent metagenome]|uniref:Uncharacterized protein n=1 Tax=hydrothermal vent metagenome TaxID=652676 RepID=A0A3B1CJW9_9ZZZZ